MPNKNKIIAISGSTRAQSMNAKYINAVRDLSADYFDVSVYERLTDLPHFNPDLHNDDVSSSVTHLRNTLKAADGILICTPEYAFGIPGALKNLIDWTVSSADFYNKPVALITASTSGEKAHASFLETLKIIGSKMTDDTQVLISSAKTKINAEQKIVDNGVRDKLMRLIVSFAFLMDI